MASSKEIDDFLQSAQQQSFKRVLYSVRDEAAALDIVQDSMIKLVTRYGDKPAAELAPLFYRIVQTTTLDWFRRQKTRKGLLVNFSDIGPADAEGDDFDFLEIFQSLQTEDESASPDQQLYQKQVLATIEAAIAELPARQREAFMLRYWEEYDTNETAELMGCSAGSVKTHCSRAVAALAKSLAALRPASPAQV